MKKRLTLLLGLPVLLLAGCQPDGSTGNPLRGIAASIVAGNAYDRATVALNHRNEEGLKKAEDDLKRAAEAGVNRGITASLLIGQGNVFLAESETAKGDQKTKLLAQSEQKYREALTFVPLNAPETALSPNDLNSLGYFLADKGSSAQDFEHAVALTQAALQNWPAPSLGTYIGAIGTSPALIANASSFERAMVPQDSYAWALYKSGKLEQARTQQEEVLKVTRAIAPSLLSAEIPFHLAEIYRALGEKEKALKEYSVALALDPSPDLVKRIKQGVLSLDSKQV